MGRLTTLSVGTVVGLLLNIYQEKLYRQAFVPPSSGFGLYRGKRIHIWLISSPFAEITIPALVWRRDPIQLVSQGSRFVLARSFMHGRRIHRCLG